jgi:hypothetical protein
MVRAAAVLAASVMSIFVPGMPVGAVVAMGMAALVGLAASRLHGKAETRAGFEPAGAAETLRVARLCDDGALALCVLAMLFALPV